MLKEFREFAMKGNVVDLAVGVVIGAAFGKIVDSLVKDIIMPPIGLVLGGVDFSQLKWVLKDTGDPATTVSINYGTFITSIITFIVIAFVVWRIAVTFVTEAPPEEVKTCPFCKEANAVDASKCKACTSAI
jgi:large conductance mechanosensitive channel